MARKKDTSLGSEQRQDLASLLQEEATVFVMKKDTCLGSVDYWNSMLVTRQNVTIGKWKVSTRFPESLAKVPEDLVTRPYPSTGPGSLPLPNRTAAATGRPPGQESCAAAAGVRHPRSPVQSTTG